MENTDFLIIGGGLAGLYSAYRLSQAGLPFELLEGSGKVGGRIAAAPAPEPHPSVLDVGPTWFWPHQQRMQRLLKELGVSWYPQYAEGDALFQMNAANEPVRTPGAGAMLSYRVAGGMTALIDGLFSELDSERIHAAIKVVSARRDGDGWVVSARVHGEEKSYRARALVAALPPRMLENGLTPGFWASSQLQEALASQQTWMAAQAKFVAAYTEPFWRAEGLAGDAFSRAGPLVEIHDATDDKTGTAALFGFVGLSANQRESVGHQSLADACLNQLATLFGENARETLYSFLKDWSKEPLVAASQDLAEPPAHASFPMSKFDTELESLGLHLTGSEYARREPGHLEGALEASDRWLKTVGIDSNCVGNR